jgi:hypothetical protein
MAGASITVTDVVPALNKKMIYFSATTDGDDKLDFSDYSSVDWISVVVAATLVPEPVTAYTAGGDITLTSTSTAVKGVALVNL